MLWLNFYGYPMYALTHNAEEISLNCAAFGKRIRVALNQIGYNNGYGVTKTKNRNTFFVGNMSAIRHIFHWYIPIVTLNKHYTYYIGEVRTDV